ncbi:MAG: NAD(P)-binding domain-containing protein, partial [bacterium]|nr:NAD(P)-binding domain-containing protein [bacterium]
MKDRLGIIGLGRMGGALYLAFKKLNLNVKGYDRSERSDFKSLNELCENSDVIFICVKPLDVQEILENISDFKDKLYVSTAAGVSNSFYENRGFKNILRIMPNINVMSLNGVIAASRGKFIKDSDYKKV